MNLEIPSLEKFLKESKPWGINRCYWAGKWHENYKFYDQQRTNPEVKGLLNILGLKESQKVLCVAGHKATWALALAKAGLKVSYSELSEELTKYVERNVKHKNIKKYISANYILFPSKLNEFDWTFTFEAVGPRAFISLLSLQNTQGGKYVIWDQDKHAERKLNDLSKTMDLCKKIYKAKGSIISRQILSEIRTGEKKKRKHHVATIQTSDKIQKMIDLDLKVFKYFYKRKTASISELRTLMVCSEKEIKASIKRVSSWSKLFDEKLLKNVSID